MYHSTTLPLPLFAATYAGMAQSPYTVCPKNYRLELENDWVRVSRAMFAQGDKLPVHDHPARPTVFVYLTDGGPIRFTHIQPEFTAERPAVREGGIRFHTGAKETHVVEYLGRRALRVSEDRIEDGAAGEEIPARSHRASRSEAIREQPTQDKQVPLRIETGVCTIRVCGPDGAPERSQFLLV